VPAGFYKLVSFGVFSCFFQFFLASFRVSSFFGVFRISFGFQVFSIRMQLRVKNKTRTSTWFCAGQVRVQVTSVKIHLNPHPSGVKPVGYPKLEPELSSLI
jgi:hypothetical protein